MVDKIDLKSKALDSINKEDSDAQQTLALKKAEYEAAKTQEEIFAELKSKAESMFNSAQARYMDSDPNYTKAYAEYSSALSSFKNAENNTAISRGSLMDSIFFAGKMGNTAIIANSILG